MNKYNHKNAQRAVILEYLKHNKHHPNIIDIYKNVSIKRSTLSMTPVYHTMDLITQDGLVYELPKRHVEGMIFDSNLISRSRLICTSCGIMVDVEDDVDHSLLVDEIRMDGFAIRMISIEFYGLCAHCKKMENESI